MYAAYMCSMSNILSLSFIHMHDKFFLGNEVAASLTTAEESEDEIHESNVHSMLWLL